MIGVLSAEWLKLRSVRSTYYMLGIVVVIVGLAAALAGYAAVSWDQMSDIARAHFRVAPLPPLTQMGVSLCMGILGALTITSEYTTGMIRASCTAVPTRRAVLAAKATVVGGVTFIVGKASVFGTSAISRAVIADRPIRGQPTGGIIDQFPLLFALGLVVMVFGLLGLGLGAITRSAAATIGVLVGLWYVFPIVVYNLPAPWNDRIGSLMLTALPGQLANTGNAHGVGGDWLSPPFALLVLAAYVVLPLVAATVLIRRRDV